MFQNHVLIGDLMYVAVDTIPKLSKLPGTSGLCTVVFMKRIVVSLFLFQPNKKRRRPGALSVSFFFWVPAADEPVPASLCEDLNR